MADVAVHRQVHCFYGLFPRKDVILHPWQP